MKVAIAHEWLVRYAGSERVVEQLLLAFPNASLHSILVAASRLPPILRHSTSSFLQRIPGATAHHEWLLPLMPLAWKTKPPVSEVDLLVSSSHACVRSVRVSPSVAHLCYCHTPMRYAWDFDAERSRFPPVVRPLAQIAMTAARPLDRRTAQRVSQFVANSNAVAERILRYYGKQAIVIHPPVDTEFFRPDPSVERDGYLYVGRLVGYKRPDLVVEAFRTLAHRLTVIGDGPLLSALQRRAPSNVTFIPSVSAEELRRHYRSAKALVFPADEDFGIAMAEAQACGTPVIGLSTGGAADIVDHDRTGVLLSEPSLSLVRSAVGRIERSDFDADFTSARARRFSPEAFRTAMVHAARETVDQHRATLRWRSRSRQLGAPK